MNYALFLAITGCWFVLTYPRHSDKFHRRVWLISLLAAAYCCAVFAWVGLLKYTIIVPACFTAYIGIGLLVWSLCVSAGRADDAAGRE